MSEFISGQKVKVAGYPKPGTYLRYDKGFAVVSFPDKGQVSVDMKDLKPIPGRNVWEDEHPKLTCKRCGLTMTADQWAKKSGLKKGHYEPNPLCPECGGSLRVAHGDYSWDTTETFAGVDEPPRLAELAKVTEFKYNVNASGDPKMPIQCPDCGAKFARMKDFEPHAQRHQKNEMSSVGGIAGFNAPMGTPSTKKTKKIKESHLFFGSLGFKEQSSTLQAQPRGMNQITQGQRDKEKTDSMDIRGIIKEIGAGSAIDERDKRSAVNWIYKNAVTLTDGIHSDQYWKPVHAFFSKLRDSNINYTIESADYEHNEKGQTVRKIWKFVINFMNKRGTEDKIYGRLVAHGAGTVQDPLSRYDITVTMG